MTRNVAVISRMVPSDRDEFARMVAGARVFNRERRRVSAEHPKLSVDAVKEKIWERVYRLDDETETLR